MLRRVVVTYALAASVFVASPSTALTQWGTGAFAVTADCPSSCSFLPFSGSMTLNQAQSFINVADLRGHGTAEATLALSGSLNVPLVRAEAYSTSSNAGAIAAAIAAEGYTYNGGGTGSFTLNIQLDGTIGDPTPFDFDTKLFAEIYIFEEAGFDFIASQGSGQNAINNGAVAIDFEELTLFASGTATGSVSFSLAPGESVYALARLIAHNEHGGFADGYNTLSMSFADTTGLVSASPIPEPGTLPLLGFGLAALARRRSARR